MVWLWALSEGMDSGGYEVINYEGGYYVTYAYRDREESENRHLYGEALAYIKASRGLELDIRPGHWAMGHIITPPDVIAVQGWAQMEAFVPVRLKRS